MITVTFTKEDKSINLQEFVDFLNTKLNEYYQEFFPSLCTDGPYSVASADIGKKFIKIVVDSRGSRSVYAFLDMNGNIYKSASWKAPAKHIRGSIFDKDFGWGSALGPYGAAYLR